MLNNALLQFVDRMFLAKESMASLEAALPASMLAWLIIGFFQSIVAYSGTFVAQYHGAGNDRGAILSYRAGSAIAVFSGIIAAALIPAGLAIVPLISDSPEVVSRAKIYFAILSLGAIAVCGHMAASSYFTARSKTRLVFWVNVGGNLLNVALDALLIFGLCGLPRLGIAGAGIATLLASFTQWAVLALLIAKEHSAISVTAANEAPAAQSAAAPATSETAANNKASTAPNAAATANPGKITLVSLAGRILKFGIPSGAYSILNVLSFTIFVFITGKVGDVAFAVSNACFSVNWLLIAPMEGFAIGASTLVAQAQGRGDAKGARFALRRTLVLALSTVTLLSLGAVVFHHPILALFAPSGPEAAEFHSLGFKLIVLMAAWQIFDAADVVICGALKGAGDTKFVMWWMVVAAFVFWLPLVWAVKLCHNTMGALWGTMVAYVILISIGSAIRWHRGKWSCIKLV